MSNVKVMIVDDATFMRQMLRYIIEELGYEVVAEASTGMEAILLYPIYQPDLVTMDIIMPEMDGITAMKQMIAAYDTQQTKFIMCSSTGHKDVMLEALESGATDFIIKPFHRERISDTIKDLFPSVVQQ